MWIGSHLDDHKACAAGVGTCEVDSRLVAGDVKPLDGSTLLERRGVRGSKAEDGCDGDGGELHVYDLLQIVDTIEKVEELNGTGEQQAYIPAALQLQEPIQFRGECPESP